MPNICNKTSIFLGACLLGSVVSATALPAQAVNVKAAITVDNSYALYYGTETAATNYVGNDSDWTLTELYNFNLPSSNYLYLVTVSDLAVAQGFLGQFENLDTGYKFYSNDPQWQVTATGLRNQSLPNYGAPYTNSLADITLLTNEIIKANLGPLPGHNASKGWVATSAGPVNGSGPWNWRPSIDAAARWVWYDSGKYTGPFFPGYPTITGLNHDEWLVFRIRIGATPDQPLGTQSVPGPMPVLGAASAWAWSRRLRSRIRSLSS
jgi:hypothetical protein